MIEVNLSDVINSKEALNAVIEKPLEAKISFKLSRIVRALDTELKGFEEARLKKVKQYGASNEGETKVTPENMDAFTKEIDALLETPIKLENDKLNIVELGDIKIEPKHFIFLNWLFTEN